MLQLTKRTEYGLIALVHMADREGDVVSVREISEHYPIPRRLLAEVLKDLAHAALVESQRGASGGYTLARSADKITLSEIVAALEGRPTLSNCDSSTTAAHSTAPVDSVEASVTKNGHRVHSHSAHTSCDIAPVCPIRSPLSRIRDGLWSLMERTTLRSLARPNTPTVSLHAAMPVHVGAASPSSPRNEPS